MSKSSGKEKELTLPERFKSFLRFKNVTQSQPEQHSKRKYEDYVLASDTFQDIGPESSINHRLKSLKRLAEEIQGKKLEKNAVETIWMHIYDLLQPHQIKLTRQNVFEFLNIIVCSQYDWLEMMRAKLFQVISRNEVLDDLVERIELLKNLTKAGREIEHFEEEIGPFLLETSSMALSSSAAIEYLNIIINLIKFNSSYLSTVVVNHIVSLTCHYACHITHTEDVKLCLQVLDVIIKFSGLPSESLERVITTLCYTVNVEQLSYYTVKIVRNLMGTHLGHSGLYIMCSILEEPANRDQVTLLRAAVCFTGMVLWGSQRVPSLNLTHSVVLPYFLKAIEGNSEVVGYEVSLSLQRLVKKFGHELEPGTWDLIMTILEKLIGKTIGKTNEQAVVLSSSVHDVLSLAEQCYVSKKFSGCEKKLFAIIEKCSARRPESSVLRLLDFQAASINPLKSKCFSALKLLIESYYKNDSRTCIRIRVLELVEKFYKDNLYFYADDIVEKIVLTCLNSIENETDMQVRNAAIRLFLIVAQDCNSKFCFEILDALSRVIERPFDQSHYPGGKLEAQETVHVISEDEITDIKLAIRGLVALFEKKILQLPSSIPIYILKIFLRHMQLQYESSVVFKDAGCIRVSIYECLLKLRADENHRIGLADQTGSTIEYSSYLCCYSDKHYGPTSPPPISPTPFSYSLALPTYMSLEPVIQIIIISLKQEKDWVVLKFILQELPKLLQNKTLVLSAPGIIAHLCQAVCGLIGDQSLHLPDSLRNSPVTLSKLEFYTHVYPIEVSFVSYCKYLDPNVQHLLVHNLKHGLTSKCAPACIAALTICSLEMTGTMVKLLPAVLLSLSKISATVNIATSILEFLSTLIRLPTLYASFVQEQYMSIFAIAVPYTNPFKFNHYTVSLAYHVIAVWFIKCRIAYRKDFVRYIIKGLRNNTLLPATKAALAKSEAPRAEKDQDKGAATNKPNVPEVSIAFHRELTETCIDLLNRYTFSGCSALPKRSAIVEFLLTNGKSGTWIVGNSVITITTSGCSLKPGIYGICEKCFSSCKKDDPIIKEKVREAESASAAADSSRRRHHSAAVRRSFSVDSDDADRQTQDDLHVLKMIKENKESSLGPHLCGCWCKEWAEILIRRPTGNTSWMMRIQNQPPWDESPNFPLDEIANLIFNKGSEEKPRTKFGHERINSESEKEKEHEEQDFGSSSLSRASSKETSDSVDQHPPLKESAKTSSTSDLGKEQKAGVRFEEISADKRPKFLHSPLFNTSSAPLSPLPLLQNKISEDLHPIYRDRCNTIAVMSPIKTKIFAGSSKQLSTDAQTYGIDPRFVFLQLFHSYRFGNSSEKPIYFPKSELVDRALMLLDHIPPHDTHKIGVLYVGPGQTDSEADVLANEFGSARYFNFLHGLGHLLRLKDVNTREIYIGGLELFGGDGKFAYVWSDDVMQVVFHVATLMPTRKNDTSCVDKKKHIGNDFVSIVYNDSGKDFNIHTIKGQFMYSCVIIHPLDHDSNLVTVKSKPELSILLGNSESKIISDYNLPILARQMALHANLASMILQSQQRSSADPYASNWLERLRHIKRLREKRLAEIPTLEDDNCEISDTEISQNFDDFTRFV